MKSFTFRLTLRFALLVTATTAVVLIAGGLLLDHQVEHGLEMLHEVEATELGGLLGHDAALTPAAVAGRIKMDADSDAALFLIQVERRDGEVLFRSANLGETILPAPSDGATHWTTRLPYVGRVHLSVFDIDPWRIHIGSLLRPSERLLGEYARVSLMLILGVALASVALGYGFSRDTLRPIRAIEATARRIRADNLGERVPVPSGRDELAALTRLLNGMFDRLEASFEQVRRFTADASHELKTPLALIRLNAEKIRTRLSGDAEAQAALEDILEEIDQLNRVIETLLFIAKSESGALTPKFRAVAVTPLLRALAEDAAALAEDRGVGFRLAGGPDGELRGEPELLRQLLLNLVTNAVTVTPPGGTVTLEWSAGEEEWNFVLTDEGPGLPEAQLAKVFERFFRFEHAPGAVAGERRGHGLGLAICRAIAELHGGSVRAENRSDRSGLRLIVRLPATRSASV